MVAQPGATAWMGGGIGVENGGKMLAQKKLVKKQQEQQKQQKQQEKWGTSAVVPVPVVVPPLPKEMDRPVKKQVVEKEEK